MFKDLVACDIGKTDDVVAEFFDVGRRDSCEDELLDVGVDNSARFELGKGIFVDSVSLGNFCAGAAKIGMDSRIGRDGWCCRSTGECHVAGTTDNEKKMAMCAGAGGAEDGSGVFKDFFFKEGDGGMVRFAFVGTVERCEFAVGERGDDFAHGAVLMLGVETKVRQIARRTEFATFVRTR